MEKGFFAVLSCLLLLGAAGCGARYGDGEALEKQGRLLQAADKYRAFALRNPADPSSPKALLSAAEIYAVRLGLCAQSKPLLERLVREYPSYKLPEDVFRRIFVCPDYFPAGAGARWKYGDSQTLGQNAVQTLEVTGRGAKGSVAKSSFYAGDQAVGSQQKVYRFSGLNFLELQDGAQTLLLAYPLERGKTWTSRGPEGRLEFRVEQTGLKVKVAAGEFADCVKVSRRTAGLPSWINEYYAPWTGKVLTSIGGRGYENRVTELLEYEEKK